MRYPLTYIKVGPQYETHNTRVAIEYVKTVLLRAKDWQDGQFALSDHPTIGPWLRGSYGEDAITKAQGIISIAEDELGDKVPY